MTKAIGAADDGLEANGETVLSSSQALTKARGWCDQQGRPPPVPPYTVGEAIADSLAWYARHRKALYEVTRRAEMDILAKLGGIPVDELAAKTIRRWHERLAAFPPRLRSSKTGPKHTREMPTHPEGPRKRRTTADKVLVIFKAALNSAFEEDHVANDEAWRRVKSFRDGDAARVRYL